MLETVKAMATDAPVEWAFEVNPPMGGAAGEAYTNTLASSGMHPAEVLAREAIQNSVDARTKGETKVAVDFIVRSLEGQAKASFVRSAGLGSIRERANDLKMNEPNCLGALGDKAVPLNLLYINDRNTTGLAGDPKDPDSKFYRFLLSLGDGGKEHDEHGTGGSYGFGKSVYSSNSGILSIFAYSRTVDENGSPLSLLFGCGYYRKHRFNKQHFTGRSWFGQNLSGMGQQIVDPLRNSAADDMAAELGFEPRATDDLGTSVLIVDAMVAPQDILRGVEDWWWPRIVDSQLDVRVIDKDGVVNFPRPKKREDLRPFLEAYYVAKNVSPPNNKTEFRRPLTKLDNISLGVAGFKLLQKNEKDDYAVDESRVDSVALVRAPLMVVSYYRQWNVQNPGIVGTFIADDEIDDVLRAAEPPAHDRWDIGARRLQDKTGRNRLIVDRVLKSIKRNLKQCQTAASPPPPPRPKRLTVLERTLANFLTPSKKGGKPNVEPSSAPIHLTYEQEPRAEAVGDKLRLSAVFHVKLKADEELSEVPARVRITCPVLEDGQTGDPINLQINADVVFAPDTVREGWLAFDLTHQGARFQCVSEAYNPLWTVRFVPEVEPVEVK
ncbi:MULTISPECIES: hypothetical protein [unclassified Rhizobium]|uniref:hypothetical protein n=1 Tax=unclassified Rhizobium TaxID=2613769 RepID=UPI0007EB32C2|nr:MULTISPECIES: hypothetical protein [unclassified Rhizobium]ANK87414.1 hypothetical protein AMK02_CH03892 [Rhizobium sp. N731]ANL17660.1 hypothetical protein AMJ97_CH03890 [Rhizobium sp. N1314]